MAEHMSPVQSEPRFPAGEYKIEGVLGTGGMAVVYKARDLKRERRVAIKVLRAEVAQLIGAERFRREITVASGLSHPNILPLLDSGESVDDEGRITPYYVMPLIEGESLAERIRRETRLNVADALRITREILDALQYAHAQGVIHRDIKPANVLLSADHAVVADFGLARTFSGAESVSDVRTAITISGFAVGTPAYMSPEQALGDTSVDVRTDLYSLGCVLYEMITGVTPFDAPTAQSIIARKMKGAFVGVVDMRPAAPAQLEHVLRRALAPERSDRFASAKEFLHAIEDIEDSSRPTRIASVARTTHRRRSIVVGALSLAAVTVIGLFAAKARRAPAASVEPPMQARVAVLPFGVLSPNPSLTAVAHGLTTDLIDELAQYPALLMISRNGVAPFSNTTLSPDSVARILNVGSLVTGDVREFGDSVRVTVRLIEAVGNAQLATVDVIGAWDDVLSVRSAILDSVTDFLRAQLGNQIVARQREEVKDPEAWALSAQAQSMIERELLKSGSLSASERARKFATADSLLQRASQLDDRWTEPYVQQGRLLLLRANLEDNARFTNRDVSAVSLADPTALRREAVRVAERALARRNSDAKARHLRGKARLELWRTARPIAHDSLRAAAEADFRYAVERRRDMAVAWNDLSMLLQMTGKYAEARTAAEAALKADAFLEQSNAVVARLSFTSLASRRPDDARTWCAYGQQRFPADPRFWGCELTILGWTGNTPADVETAWQLLRTSEARDSLNQLASGRGTFRLLVAAIAARAGLADSARAIVATTRASATSDAESLQLDYGEAHVHSILGDADRAIELLERYVRANPALRGQVRQSPWFDALRTNAKFLAITEAQ